LYYRTYVHVYDYADDTAVVATDSDPAIASQKLQNELLAIQNWLRKWRIKSNESKSTHITFTTRRETCSPVHKNSVQLPEKKMSRILGYAFTGDLPGTNTFSQNGNN
jgi:hypothetical protein